MKEIKHDDERLAALLAGRLDGPEREELLAHLLNDEEDYQVFADTAAILQEAEDEDAVLVHPATEQESSTPAHVTLPPSTKPGWRRRASRWIVPAVLAGLAVLVPLMRGLGRSAPALLRVAGNFENPQHGVPAGWTEPAWRGSRGDERAAADRASSVRAGVTLMDLTVAAQAGDSAMTRRLAERARGFDRQGGTALLEIRDRAGEPYDVLEPRLEGATKRLEGRLNRDYLRLGGWAEAARLAANRQDAAFFRSGDTRAMLRHAERLTRDDVEARGALSRIRAAIPDEGTLDWPVLERETNTLLAELGS